MVDVKWEDNDKEVTGGVLLCEGPLYTKRRIEDALLKLET